MRSTVTSLVVLLLALHAGCTGTRIELERWPSDGGAQDGLVDLDGGDVADAGDASTETDAASGSDAPSADAPDGAGGHDSLAGDSLEDVAKDAEGSTDAGDTTGAPDAKADATGDVTPGDIGTPDTGTTDTGTTDTGTTDAGATDTGATDTGATDSGATDTGTTDSGTTDSGTTDTGATDTAISDTGTTDIGATDTGATDTGATDTGATDTGATDTGTTDTGAEAGGDAVDGGDAAADTSDAGSVAADMVALCGQVTESGTGLPVAGATVTLTADGVTVASVVTDAQGNFCFAPSQAGGVVVWAMLVAKVGYAPTTKVVGGLTLGKTTWVSVTLVKSTFAVCDEDGFELLGWQATPAVDGVGWQVRDHNVVVSNAATGKCVSLPPDESCKPGTPDCVLCAGPKAVACLPKPGALPRAYEGTRYAWFGNPASGNYLGKIHQCLAANGGTSKFAALGDYTSPVFKVPAKAKELRLSFAHWFEVESQAQAGLHDRMEVAVSLDGQQFVLLATLTPITLANGAQSQGHSSAGFFAAPRWVQVTLSIPAAISQAAAAKGGLSIRLRFDTVDKQNNGFRGWAIDAVRVLGSGC